MGEIRAVYDRSHVINGRLRPAYGHRNVGPGIYSLINNHFQKLYLQITNKIR